MFNKNNLYIILLIIVILVIFYPLKENYIKENYIKENKIKKLIRQAARWSHAARQDNNNLIGVLHANYGAGYLWAMKDIFTEKEINNAIGSEEKRIQFEKKIIEIQDKITKKAVKDCPNYAGDIDFLSSLGGES